jgi:Trk-type K+ transport system membrane component
LSDLLQIGNAEITRYSPGIEFLDGLFQAFAVRSGGFYIVPIPTVRISLQVLYAIMMYISAFPVAITIRNSNVYEERSLGIYSDDPGFEEMEAKGKTLMSWARKRFGGPTSNHKGVFVQQQLRAQLAHDLWWLVLAVFLIMIIEGSQFQRDPVTFSVFNVIFEVVSGESFLSQCRTELIWVTNRLWYSWNICWASERGIQLLWCMAYAQQIDFMRRDAQRKTSRSACSD